MLPPEAFTLDSSFALWLVIILLCLMGLHDFATLAIHWSFQLCRDVHEEYYDFLARCEENRRRYRQSTRKEN